MGTRDPDKIHAADWRRAFETVDRMRRARWRVGSLCGCCGTKLRTPLAAAIRLHGEGLSLWNRTAPCLVDGCTGRVRYEGWPMRRKCPT
jgi:hypothetical protein